MPNSQPKITRIDHNSFVYNHNSEFELVNGQCLDNLVLAYETYGELNANQDNVVLLHHSLSMSAHAYNYRQGFNDTSGFDYDHKSQNGWWDNMIGHDKPIDPNKHFIICINNLGSCFGTSGPVDYHGDFPVITIHDMVKSQKLLLDYLGIHQLHLIVGSSMGGMLSLAWLQLYPKTVENLFVAACAHKAYPINIFNRMIQQEIINLDKGDKKKGLKLARMLGFFNYRSNDELSYRFDDCNVSFNQAHNKADYKDLYKYSELYNYFSYNADKFVDNFDASSYQCLLTAMDLFDLTIEKSYHPAGYADINPNTKIVVVGIDSDILFPIAQQKDICTLLKSCGYNPFYIEHHSLFGHDSFLIEFEKFGRYLLKLLEPAESALRLR